MFGFVAATLLAPTAASAHMNPNGHRFHHHGYHRNHLHHHRFHPDRTKIIVRPFRYSPDGLSSRHFRNIHGVCTEHRALVKAIKYGIADPRIMDYGNRIVVDGYRFHTRVRIVMNNVAGCPLARF